MDGEIPGGRRGQLGFPPCRRARGVIRCGRGRLQGFIMDAVMPHELSIISAGEFLRCGSHGATDFAASRKVLMSLAQALVRRGVDKAILDIRKAYAEPPLTYTQLYELARAFQESG